MALAIFNSFKIHIIYFIYVGSFFQLESSKFARNTKLTDISKNLKVSQNQNLMSDKIPH